MPVYPLPGEAGAPVSFKPSYDNWIGGKPAAPIKGEYFDVVTPITGKPFTKAARSGAEDVEAALDAAHKAAPAWGATPVQERSRVLLKVADVIEANLEKLAYCETVGNGKPIRESLAADLPLCVDHFRYFAGVLRAQEGTLSQLDATTVAYHEYEPLGVVGQIVPWNFSLLMPVWKLAPALAAGNAVVMKVAESTPTSIMVLMEMLADVLPPGVVNVLTGYGADAGAPLAASKRIAKIAFTGSTGVGKQIALAAAANLIPATLELGGKSPVVFMPDVMDADDAFLDKAIEGFVSFCLNSGEVCTCPSRALIHESIVDRFLERALKRVAAIKTGSPLDTETALGAQNSAIQLARIQRYLDVGKAEGAQVLAGGERLVLPGELEGGYYVKPTVFKGHNKMTIFQEEIFGPVVSVCTFKDVDEAIAIANDTRYGLGAGVWTRNINDAHKISSGIKAGRVWVNCYHLYPAHATFGGYKESGLGRETHASALQAYQQVKNKLVSYSPNAMGFF